MAQPTVSLDLEGAKEMTRRLERIGTKTALRGPNAAVRAGGSAIVREMRRRAPRDTGSLRKSLGQRVKTYRRDGTVVSIVGARSRSYETDKGRRNPAFYAHLVEFGTAPHKLGGGTHPGAQAHPFMRPAWDTASPEAKRAVIAKMQQVLEREAQKEAVQ